MKIRNEIHKALTPPEPAGRDKFLSALPYPKLSLFDFVIAQIGFIRKRVWVLSALIPVLVVCVIFMPNIDLFDIKLPAVRIAASLLPFLAMLTAGEISRSCICRMTEIESACRFGLSQLITARMIILGICNFAVISAVTAVSGIYSPVGILQAALYILTPYLAINGISLAVLNRFRGSDGMYICAGITFAVSISEVLSTNMRIEINESTVNFISLTVCIIGILMIAFNAAKIIKGDKNYGTLY